MLSWEMAIHVGCGSWADPEYAGLLYPAGFPPELRLSGYAMWFDHVEVNASYYATPRKETVAQWVENTPLSFLFDVRLHRAFSQSPEKTAKEGRFLGYLLEGLQPLLQAKKFGTFLLVLSPFFAPERHRLEELDILIQKILPYPLAIELRHRGWVDEKTRISTLAFFRDRKVTWVAVDMPQLDDSSLMPPVDEVTQPSLAYLRLHGRNPSYLKAKSAAERHTFMYTEDELGQIISRVRVLATQAKHVRVVANNHAHDFAPKTALRLKERLGQFS
jgi:uncharacterized protein YecE (DUF72 family)